MEFGTLAQLIARFKDLGATRIFCKHLSENDNSKQQVYLGSNFEVLSFFPYGDIAAYSELKQPNFKAPLDFFWVDSQQIELAKDTQLILYPAYPEVRLSGFLSGCKSAPSQNMKQVTKLSRRGFDGRVLVFGTTKDGRTLAYLAIENSQIALELLKIFSVTPKIGLFLELTLPIGSSTNRASVLEALKRIHEEGFLSSRRMSSSGESIAYKARNGGGYTLEALLGIIPNSDAEPDYLGWEIKAYSRSRITLMTSEPDGGYYGEKGAKAFVLNYGHKTSNDTRYFTGNHLANRKCKTTGMTLRIFGFNPEDPGKIDVTGSICLVDAQGKNAASWSFAQLLSHWNRKHAFAAYVPYTSHGNSSCYLYESPILMGEHTDFTRYINALYSGYIAFDPASKVTRTQNGSKVKVRSQFRSSVKNLSFLYEVFNSEKI